MNKLYSLFFSLFAFALVAEAQIITTTPEFPTVDDEVTVVFDATQGAGGLKGYTGDVYAHTGVNTKEGGDWKYAPGWGNNSSKYKLKSLGNNKWEFKISPTIRAYYGVQSNETVTELCFVFRSTDKSKQTENIFADVYQAGLNVFFEYPVGGGALLQGETLEIKAKSSQVATLTLFIDDVQIASVANTKEITESYVFNQSGTYELKVEATDGTDKVSAVTTVGVTQDETLPGGVRPGINYISNTSATLVLQAPGKKTVYVLGDFNDWQLSAQYQLKRDGEYFWITLDGLTPHQEYAFQYLVDGNISIADPYTEKVLDPWNDSHIPPSVYPNLKPYPTGKAEGIVSVLQTAQQPYQWQATDFEAPHQNQLIIYEMLIRDFTEEHSYKAAIDKLDYLQELGVNAIELMPVNEFEGNSSWGYNPSFYFAPDKYYGTKNDLKAFVDECHNRGMAVILDLVLNHSFSQSPLYQLYKDGDKPAADNPWYNVQSNITNPDLQWGYDFNHESAYTEVLVDSVASFWMSEYKIDGFRYDFTKGFSNTKYTGTDNWASGYDAARITILKRMTAEVRKRNPNAYIIFEHLTDEREEKELAQEGIMLWRNMNYAYCQSAMGWSADSDFTKLYSGTSMPAGSLVGYMESHDEERTSYKAKTWGDGSIKTDLAVRMKQAQTNAAFFFTVPGPKLIWQFGELGYDISIDENGRTGEKPVLWNYYDDVSRRELYNTYSKLIGLRLSYPELFASATDFSWQVSIANWANGRFITSVTGNKAMVIAGNFTATDGNYQLTFPSTGKWYEYMSNTTINVTSTTQTIKVPAHEFRLYLNFEPVITDVEDVPVDDRLKVVYYNQASDQLEIINNQTATIEVYSVNGILVQKQENVSSTGLSVLPSGYYIIKAYLDDGRIESCKVVR